MKLPTSIVRGARLILFSAILTALVLATPDRAAAEHPHVFSPDSKPYGKSYAEWQAVWWQWAYSIPVDENPLFDDTGDDAGNGQQGKVFFLGGSFLSGAVTRTITVPHGKALFFPIVNFENDNFCPPNCPPLDEEQLRQGAAQIIDGATDLVCEIDGVAVKHLRNYRHASPVFSVEMPEDNVYEDFGCDAPAGTYDGLVNDGYYVMVKPLEKGEHTIYFHASVPDQDFTLDISYHITVESLPRWRRVFNLSEGTTS
jgi:hypothetical protein